MTIWILALLLLGLLALSGYYQGAIRAGVSLIGFLLGVALAFPLGPTVQPLIPLVGLAHPVWSWVLPPVLVVVLIEIVFVILGFVAHRPVYLYFKYKTNDMQRHAWERINQRLGACLGLLTGACYTLLIAVLIYGPGYLTVQLAADDKDPGSLKFLNHLRLDLHSSGLDKAAALFDPLPKRYYEVADFLGLLRHNYKAEIKSRIASYPPLYALSQRDDLREITGDNDYIKLFDGQASLVEIASHPRTLSIINNAELSQELLKLNLKDFQIYLEKAQSPVYDSYKILGRWELDVDQVVILKKKMNPDISARELMTLRQVLSTMISVPTITATCDNKIWLSIVDFAKLPKSLDANQPSAHARTNVTAAATGRSAMDSATARRYGLNPGAQTAAPSPATNAPPRIPVRNLQGTWEGDADNYTIKFQGISESIDAAIEGDEMNLTLYGQKLIFVKQ
jgi:hypothetical protein